MCKIKVTPIQGPVEEDRTFLTTRETANEESDINQWSYEWHEVDGWGASVSKEAISKIK